MITPVKALLTALIVAAPIFLLAQDVSQKDIKQKDEKVEKDKKDDKFSLVCPFENGSGRIPKEAFSWDPPDHKVVMISQVDTIIRSCISGEVVNVQPNEDGKYEVVIYYKDHYFWYNNVDKPRVVRLQKVTAGQKIGIYKFGDELELRVYKEPKRNEPELIDPREMLECKIPKD